MFAPNPNRAPAHLVVLTPEWLFGEPTYDGRDLPEWPHEVAAIMQDACESVRHALQASGLDTTVGWDFAQYAQSHSHYPEDYEELVQDAVDTFLTREGGNQRFENACERLATALAARDQ